MLGHWVYRKLDYLTYRICNFCGIIRDCIKKTTNHY